MKFIAMRDGDSKWSEVQTVPVEKDLQSFIPSNVACAKEESKLYLFDSAYGTFSFIRYRMEIIQNFFCLACTIEFI
jgi:hypothetical protein